MVKTWVENYWYDFARIDARQARLTWYLTEKLATDPHFTKPAHKLLYTISRKVHRGRERVPHLRRQASK